MTKIAIAAPDDSNEFRLKECLFHINEQEKRENDYEILYIRGILYSTKQNYSKERI